MHGSGRVNNPPVLFLDGTEPDLSKDRYTDSPALDMGSSEWIEIGTWDSGSSAGSGSVSGGQMLRVWLGLMNSSGKGLDFDLQAQLLSDGELLAQGESLGISGLSHHPQQQLEHHMELAPEQDAWLDAGDALALRLLARVSGDQPGYSNSSALGMRVYFDSSTCPSNIVVTLNLPPTAELSGSPLSGDAPLEVHFDASASSDPDGSIARFEWDFDGDGNWDLDSGTTATAMHTYNSAGEYDAYVRVTDDSGATDVSDAVHVSVSEPPGGGGGSGPDWMMFGHDSSHSHQSPFAGPAGNTVQWTRFTGAGSFGSAGVVVGADGTAYIGRGTRLQALDSGGTLLWEHSFGGGNDIKATPAIGPDGTIYCGVPGGDFAALNPDGSVKWNAVNFSLRGSPTVDDDGTVYAMSGGGGGMLSVMPQNGDPAWSFSSGPSDVTPAVDRDGNIYCVGKSPVVAPLSYRLFKLDSNGTLLWTKSFNAPIHSSPAVADDGTVYIGSGETIGGGLFAFSSGRFYAINADGSSKWDFSTNHGVVSSPAIGPDGSVYVGMDNGRLYSIDPSGIVNWNFSIGAAVTSAPASPAVDANGVVYIGGTTGVMRAINPDGTLKWMRQVSFSPILSTAALNADGSMTVNGGNNRLYKFNP